MASRTFFFLKQRAELNYEKVDGFRKDWKDDEGQVSSRLAPPSRLCAYSGVQNTVCLGQSRFPRV